MGILRGGFRAGILRRGGGGGGGSSKRLVRGNFLTDKQRKTQGDKPPNPPPLSTMCQAKSWRELPLK